MNPVEKAIRSVDCWQQRHPVIGLLLAFTAVLSVVLRENPELHDKLVNSAFAEFPIVGSQIQEELGIEAFSSTAVSLTVGVLSRQSERYGPANGTRSTCPTWIKSGSLILSRLAVNSRGHRLGSP
jgi:membrane protein